jgi:hypothetical protein
MIADSAEISINNCTATVSGNGITVDIDGNLTIDGTLAVDGQGVINCSGNWSNNDTFSAGSSTVVFDGSSPASIAGTVSSTFYNVQMIKNSQSTAVTPSLNFSVSNYWYNNRGTFSLGPHTVTIANYSKESGYGTESELEITDASSVLDAGNFSLQNGDAINMTTGLIMVSGSFEDYQGESFTGGTVRFDGSGTQTWNNYYGSGILPNVEVIGSSNTVSCASTSTPAMRIGGNLSIGSGCGLDINGISTYIAGDWDKDGTFTHDNGTVYFNGTDAQNISGDSPTEFYNLEVQ